MVLRLIVTDKRPDLLAIWRETFQGLASVEVRYAGDGQVLGVAGLDAALMLGVFAHERYGGGPIIGESQVVSTNGEADMPPWVVTTVPLAGHFEDGRCVGVSLDPTDARERWLTTEQEIYFLFTRVFERITRFNAGGAAPKIRTLGMDLYFLNFPLGDPRQEAEAVRRAYLEQFGEVRVA